MDTKAKTYDNTFNINTYGYLLIITKNTTPVLK